MIAFVGAERLEFSGLERHVRESRPLAWPIAFAATGHLNGRRVILAANGPGSRLVAKVGDLLKAEKLDALVSIGFCGALAESLSAAEVFVGTSVNGVGVLRPQSAPAAASGAVLSLGHVVTTVEEKKNLRRTGADVVEMEAGEVCDKARWLAPFYCVRVVTDTASESLPMDFNRLRDSDGRFSRSRIVAHAFRNPFKLIPKLIQLHRRCREAALVMGDFIASCQF